MALLDTVPTGQRKRPAFQFDRCPQPPVKKLFKAPRADQCITGPPLPTKPPPEVVAAFGSTELFVGIDVETHELAPPNKKRGAIGKFGLFGADLGDTCAHLRLVQLGWAVGRLGDDTPLTKVRVVKPNGFVVDPAATAVHRITQEFAEAKGTMLPDVL